MLTRGSRAGKQVYVTYRVLAKYRTNVPNEKLFTLKVSSNGNFFIANR